mgnify:CR=1 FL=1
METPIEKEKERTSISKTENGMTTTITVEEIENGFLVTKDTCGNKDDKWVSECKKEFSKTNPLKEEEVEEDTSKELMKGVTGLFNSLASSEGKVNTK